MGKLRALPLDTRQQMGHFIIRNRGPVLLPLAEGMDDSWLNSMAYMKITASPSNPDYVFRHTSEHHIK